VLNQASYKENNQNTNAYSIPSPRHKESIYKLLKGPFILEFSIDKPGKQPTPQNRPVFTG
jgi:hypothetical protein